MKKQYIKPELKLVVLDYSFSLLMKSQPGDKPPRPHGPPQQGTQRDDGTFASPFEKGPFS